MWVRKRIEISWLDLALAFAQALWPRKPERLVSRVQQQFDEPLPLVCLSVRSGFDLLLDTLDLPAGSEVLMTGLNIADMSRIVCRHDLIPVGLDLDLATLSPSREEVLARITSRTRVVVVAHLLGGRIDLGSMIDLARRHRLLIVEDLAQGYVGNHDLGDARADISFYSFGPIKTNTALGGAICVIRQQSLLRRMLATHATWPRQSRSSFIQRLLKYSAVRAMSIRPVAWVIFWACHLLNLDFDRFAGQLGRGFTGPRFFCRIRKRPSAPLLWLLARKLRHFQVDWIQQRREMGRRLCTLLQERVGIPGNALSNPTFWVFPVLVDDPDRLIGCLRRSGFDATRSSSLVVTDTASNLKEAWQHVVFLPLDRKMKPRDIERLAQTVVASGVGPYVAKA